VKDHFHSPEKTAYRQDCNAFLRKHAGHILLDEAGALRGRWCELAGASGYVTLGALAQDGLLSDAQFIGVDNDPGNISTNRVQRPNATWVCNDLFQALKNFDDVSVLNLDGYRGADSGPGTHEIRYLLPTIRSSVSRFGAFVLFYNTDLDSARYRKRQASETLLAHTHAVCGQLSNWFPGRCWVTDVILTGSLVRKVDAAEYVGSLGEHYFIYRGNQHRMANLKLVFR